MTALLEALEALKRLGASWKARRVSKKFLFDTIECTALVQTKEGVIRGFVEVQRWDTYCCAKMEVACFLGGHLEKGGTFKHLKHLKDKKANIFEYENVVLYHYSKVFGIGLGYKPVGKVPAEHQFIVGFVERLIADVDRKGQVEALAKVATESVRKSANKETARRALFG